MPYAPFLCGCLRVGVRPKHIMTAASANAIARGEMRRVASQFQVPSGSRYIRQK